MGSWSSHGRWCLMRLALGTTPSAIPRARYTRGISTEGEWDHEGDERGDAAMMGKKAHENCVQLVWWKPKEKVTELTRGDDSARLETDSLCSAFPRARTTLFAFSPGRWRHCSPWLIFHRCVGHVQCLPCDQTPCAIALS
jgi:hypothetical protein